MIQDVRAQPMNLPSGGQPAFGGRALLPALIVASLAIAVLVRASAMPQATIAATNNLRQAAQLSPTDTDCTNGVWPYVTSGCLQGGSQETVRVVHGAPPPDAQARMREADALYAKAMRPQPNTREHERNVMRERRARRNATFF